MSDSIAFGQLPRKQRMSRRAAQGAYPFQCRTVSAGCKSQPVSPSLTWITMAETTTQNNLAYLCQTDRWMYDAGLDPIKAIRLLRAHWQETKGVPSPQGADEGRGRESSTCPQAERQSAEGLGHPAQQPAATIQLTHYRAFWTLDHAPIMADGLWKIQGVCDLVSQNPGLL